LPMELGESGRAGTKPIVRARFESSNCLAQGRCAAEKEEGMHMVRFGVDLNGDATESVECPAQVGVKVSLNLAWKTAIPIFGREHKVDINLGERLWHRDG